jgi:hypothetical protein
MENSPVHTIPSVRKKHDADDVFYELTRSICPDCRWVIDAHILLRENKVYMRKRCPEHGHCEALIYGDARTYTSSTKFNKPGTIPLAFSTSIVYGCPREVTPRRAWRFNGLGLTIRWPLTGSATGTGFQGMKSSS